MSASQRVYVALGSNLGDRCSHLRHGLSGLHCLSSVSTLLCSSIYESPPLGPCDQPDYLNAVCRFDFDGNARQLLGQLQRLENEAGRIRGRRWGERTLDLDILLFARQRIATDELIVPHIALAERAFVLWPLAEIDPQLDVPGLGRVDELKLRCQANGIRQLPGGPLTP